MLFHEMFSLIFPCPLPQTSEVPLWAFVARCAHWSHCLLCSVAEVHLTRINTCLGALVTCFLCIPKCLIWMSEYKVIWVVLCNSVAFCRCWETITLAVFGFEGTSHVFWADQIIAQWLLINNQLSFFGGVGWVATSCALLETVLCTGMHMGGEGRWGMRTFWFLILSNLEPTERGREYNQNSE